MNIIPFAIEVAKLAILAIILWHVCGVLAMDEIPKRVCQLLIVLICILASIQMVTAGSPAPLRMPGLGPTPSIMVPERR